jgi:hypothetical protein
MTDHTAGQPAWLAVFGTPDRPRAVDGHSLWADEWGWLALNVLAPRHADFLLLCPKTVPPEWWYSPELHAGIGFLHVPFPADQRVGVVVKGLGIGGKPLLFVGDLDPVAIAQYLAARDMLAAAPRRPLRYGGMNDAWLAAMVGSQLSLSQLSIRMERGERRLLAALDAAVDLDSLVGPESAEMLRSGTKVELEAAVNPAIHGPAQRRWIFGYLRSVATAAPGQRLTLKKGRRTKR